METVVKTEDIVSRINNYGHSIQLGGPGVKITFSGEKHDLTKENDNVCSD